MFTMRRMRPDDKPALMDISSRIWNGTDYLPQVFDEWVTDTMGEFTAVVLDGRVVGCAKLTFCTATDAWLEGLRKDPRVQEKGLARAVTLHQLALLSRRAAQDSADVHCRAARRAGLTSVRFSTHITNIGSISTNERLGFRRRVVLSLKRWEGPVDSCAAPPAGRRSNPRACIAGPPEGRRRIPQTCIAGPPAGTGGVQEVRNETAVCDYLEGSGYLAATTDLVVDGWHCLPYSRDCIGSRYVRTGACRGVLRDGRLSGLSISPVRGAPGGERAPIVFLDAADDGAAGALFNDIRLRLLNAARAAQAAPGAAPSAARPACGIEWMVPDLPRLKGWCAAWGLASEAREDDFLVYELPLERLPEFAT